MNAAVLVTVVIANLAWAWVAPLITPHPKPIEVVVVSTEAQQAASNAH